MTRHAAPARLAPLAIGLAAIGLLAIACVQGGRGLEPSARIVPRASIDSERLVGYRDLVREDFQATQPPPASAAYAEHLGALVCTSIVAKSDFAIEFQSQPDATQHQFALSDPEYRAQMDRSCSWWNAEHTSTPTDYVLEHETIHFALTEIYARRISREIQGLRMSAPSREQAPAIAQANLMAILEAATRELLQESQRFDAATSHGLDRKTQAQWRLDAEARLLP